MAPRWTTVLDALEQALHDRHPLAGAELVHHSDRGSQYVSIKYTERLAEAGIEPSAGRVGDSYGEPSGAIGPTTRASALAETVIGLSKTEILRHRGPWKSLEAVAVAPLEWVDWFDYRRLLEPTGNIPPAEAEARFHAETEELATGA